MLEEKLGPSDAGGEAPIDGVLVTSPVAATGGRRRLGARVVKLLVSKASCRLSFRKWQNVILVGTKMDHSEEGECIFFRGKWSHDSLKKQVGKGHTHIQERPLQLLHRVASSQHGHRAGRRTPGSER